MDEMEDEKMENRPIFKKRIHERQKDKRESKDRIKREELEKSRRQSHQQLTEKKKIERTKLLTSSQFTCANVVESGIGSCGKVVVENRFFESRSACLYAYMRKIGIDSKEIFSICMTLPILISFKQTSSSRQIMLDHFDIFFKNGKWPKNKTFFLNIANKFLDCNIEWNKRMSNSANISQYMALDSVFLGNYENMLVSLKLYGEIAGIINRRDFVEKSKKYVNLEGKLEGVDKTIDVKCKSFSPEKCLDDCILRTSSKGQKECVNKQRLRTLQEHKISDIGRYYIIDHPQRITRKIYFEPVCVMNILTGNAGIFRWYDFVNDTISPTNKYILTFPPSDFDFTFTKKGIETIFHLFNAFYYNAYISNKTGVNKGMFGYIQSWYDNCVSDNIPKDSELFVIGVSQGGALANLATYILLLNGYQNIHMYALGSPRVGDSNFMKFMEQRYGKELKTDSGNYIRFNNIIKNETFYTEFDPIAKFPPSTWSVWSYVPAIGGHLRYSDNPILKGIGGGLVFNIHSMRCYDSQPDFDAIGDLRMGPLSIRRASEFNELVPINLKCPNHWSYIHSVSAYSEWVLNGENATSSEGKSSYSDYFDSIRNLDIKPCGEEEKED